MEMEPTVGLFENIISTQSCQGHNGGVFRQYTSISVDPNEYRRVLSTPGSFCVTPTSGAGISQWYFYHTLDGRLVTMICSRMNYNGNYH